MKETLAEHQYLELMNAALTNSKTAVFSIDLEKSEVWRSAQHDLLFGYAAPLEIWTEEIFYSHVVEEDREFLRKSQWAATLNENFQKIEFRIIGADALLRWMELSLKTIFKNEKPCQMLGTIRDVTTEKTKNDTEEALNLAHERLARVIQATGEGIWERDVESKAVRYIDEQGKRIFGFHPEENPTYEDVIDLIFSEDKIGMEDKVAEYVRSQTGRFDVEFRIHDRQNPGQLKWVRSIGQIQRKAGAPDQLVATFRDVTDEVKKRMELEKALATARIATEAKSLFLANISHEIRTPLNGIIGMTDLLLDTSLNKRQSEFAHLLQQSGMNLLALVNDVLDFSKIEAGKMEIGESAFALTPVLETQMGIMAPKARQKGLVLGSFISPDLPRHIQGDAGRISQVLLNLLSNAIKFTSEGGVSLRVQAFEAGARQKILRFEVTDTGRGIAPKNVKRLFQPFSQEDASISTQFGGTGLGLSICKKLVEAMKGQIGVLSEEGHGSTFWFELPLKAVDEKTAMEPVGWEKLEGIRVLLLDDKAIERKLFSEYLSSFKMEVQVASTLAEARLCFEQASQWRHPIQLVLVSSSLALSFQELESFLPKEETPPVICIRKFAEDLSGHAGHFSAILDQPLRQSDLVDSLTRALSGTQLKEEMKPSPPHARARDFEASGFRILVADDVPVNQMLTRAMLETLGYNCVTVGNGSEALRALEESHYDLVLMDCKMPQMDGFEATARIRAARDEKIKTLPVVALTANALEGDAEKCREAGMDDYLSKPVRRESLDEMLKKWLSVRSSQKTA
jgi:PAS domain S-box-containing protein